MTSWFHHVYLFNCNHTTAELESRSNITLLFPMLRVMLNTTQSTMYMYVGLLKIFFFFSRAQLLGNSITWPLYFSLFLPIQPFSPPGFPRLSVLAFLCLHLFCLSTKISSNTRLLAARDTFIVVVWDWFDDGLKVITLLVDSYLTYPPISVRMR